MFQALRCIHIVKIHLLAFVFKPKAWRWWELCPWVQAQANCDRASENNLHPPCHLCPWHRWSLQNLSTHHLILLVNKKNTSSWYLISDIREGCLSEISLLWSICRICYCPKTSRSVLTKQLIVPRGSLVLPLVRLSIWDPEGLTCFVVHLLPGFSISFYSLW